MQDQVELYKQLILEHNRKPKNFKVLENASHSGEGYNPICGDHLWIYLNVDAQMNIKEISFQGSGCAISKASASLMTQALMGKSLEQANEIKEAFLLLLKGQKPDYDLSKLEIFAGVCNYPARVKCAGLAWHTLACALEKQTTISCTE